MDALAAVAPVLCRLPTPLLGVLASSAAGNDVQASNLRGYPEAPYIAGAKIEKTYWFGPLPGVAMMVVLMSQAGTCFVGVHYDTASVSDGELFARCLQEGFDEVLAAAAEGRAARHDRTAGVRRRDHRQPRGALRRRVLRLRRHADGRLLGHPPVEGSLPGSRRALPGARPARWPSAFAPVPAAPGSRT